MRLLIRFLYFLPFLQIDKSARITYCQYEILIYQVQLQVINATAPLQISVAKNDTAKHNGSRFLERNFQDIHDS